VVYQNSIVLKPHLISSIEGTSIHLVTYIVRMSFKVIWEHLKGFATPLDDIKRERKKEEILGRNVCNNNIMTIITTDWQ